MAVLAVKYILFPVITSSTERKHACWIFTFYTLSNDSSLVNCDYAHKLKWLITVNYILTYFTIIQSTKITEMT